MIGGTRVHAVASADSPETRSGCHPFAGFVFGLADCTDGASLLRSVPSGPSVSAIPPTKERGYAWLAVDRRCHRARFALRGWRRWVDKGRSRHSRVVSPHQVQRHSSPLRPEPSRSSATTLAGCRHSRQGFNAIARRSMQATPGGRTGRSNTAPASRGGHAPWERRRTPTPGNAGRGSPRAAHRQKTVQWPSDGRPSVESLDVRYSRPARYTTVYGLRIRTPVSRSMNPPPGAL